jgi:chorismate mutase
MPGEATGPGRPLGQTGPPLPDAAAPPAGNGPGRGTGTRADGIGQEEAAGVAETLAGLRRSIDNIDAALTHLLAERFKHTQAVGRLKARACLPASDPEREAEQIARLRALAAESGLDPVFAEKFLNFIVAEVIRHHEAIAESAG